ncbi:polysaccharide deacetylase family protein [Streptomyces sp. NPDC096176]|uniref:polysaccharide deacetylase family protein n=1 Tax=Streptomyces sp. NPDC096176 TaxID=3366079 RepID=UPI0037F3D69F
MSEVRDGSPAIEMTGTIVEVTADLPHIVLTYDDGPEPGGTDRVMDALADRGATATFFVLLSRVRRHPSLFQRLADSPHDIGLHGPDHQRLSRFGAEEVEARIRDAKSELEDVLGREVVWFRPPYGAQTPETRSAIARCGLTSVGWGPALQDWHALDADDHVENGLDGAHPGAVLLAHDGFAAIEDGVEDGPAPVFDRGALTRRVLDAYAQRGWQGCSLTNALIHGSPVYREWFKR